MGFDVDYQAVKKVVSEDINLFEEKIKESIDRRNPLFNDLSSLLLAPSKRLRPLLGILFIKALQGNISQNQMDLLLSVELIHSASLIHDDVIDNSSKRRNTETLNKKFNENLAVVAGDFLLALAMEKIIDTDSNQLIKMSTSALKTTCEGEINQYFNKFKIISIAEYIEKSKQKTALLFEIAVLGGVLLCNENKGENVKQMAKDFSQNFGIAFQIRDDLLNFQNFGKEDGYDFSLGIYTAPVIYAYQENQDILSNEKFDNVIKNSKCIEKTKVLMDNYFNKACSAIENLEDTVFKEAILNLIDVFRLSNEEKNADR